MRPRKGDRIKVVGRMDDPCPIQIGTTGTVEDVMNEGTSLEQVWVDWDRQPNGDKRTLMLTPQDYSIIQRIEEPPDDE